jgi:deoxyribodipyrimidine photolyase
LPTENGTFYESLDRFYDCDDKYKQKIERKKILKDGKEECEQKRKEIKLIESERKRKEEEFSREKERQREEIEEFFD